MPETTSAPNRLPTIGQRVRVIALPPYVKTADSMPMLRPPSAIAIGEIGTILARHPGDTWSIRFTKGAYLLDRDYFEPVEAEAATEEMTEKTAEETVNETETRGESR
jgi:Protein of unknown function (DUF3148)